MHLLNHTTINKVYLADTDPLIHATWYAITHNPTTVLDILHSTPITLKTWKQFRNTPLDQGSVEEKAARTIFLNRTTYSGLIHHGGPLGGWDQEKKQRQGHPVAYPLDCRFNMDAITASIQRIGEWGRQGRIHVVDGDCYDCMDLATWVPRPFIYLDPPYIHKSEQLYYTPFTPSMHHKLAAAAHSHAYTCPVAVSYDDTPESRNLYPPDTWEYLFPQWSYGMGASKKSREILFTNTGRELI